MHKNITISYYWYDHCILRTTGEANIVQKAIEEHNYDSFMKIYNKYKDKTILYFPETATIYDDEDNFIGTINILNEQNFKLIDYSEYECG